MNPMNKKTMFFIVLVLMGISIEKESQEAYFAPAETNKNDTYIKIVKDTAIKDLESNSDYEYKGNYYKFHLLGIYQQIKDNIYYYKTIYAVQEKGSSNAEIIEHIINTGTHNNNIDKKRYNNIQSTRRISADDDFYYSIENNQDLLYKIKTAITKYYFKNKKIIKNLHITNAFKGINNHENLYEVSFNFSNNSGELINGIIFEGEDRTFTFVSEYINK